MNQSIETLRCKLCFFVSLLLLPFGSSFSKAWAGPADSTMQVATNLFQLRNATTRDSGHIYAYDLEGTILAADSNSQTIFFQDNSGTEALEVNLKGADLRSGRHIRLCGTNYVCDTEIGLSLGTRPLLDLDNRHSKIEKSGGVMLEAGWHPIRVNWFNWIGVYFLQVEYSGPHLARQAIPDSSLSRKNISADGKILPGLNYRCFEGEWERIPDFDSMSPQKIGVASNFDETVKTRSDNVGLDFRGFLKIPENGFYTFNLSSDDGSQLFLDDTPPNITIVGAATIPVPQPIAVSQPLFGGQDCIWAEAEGMITFIGQDKTHVVFELASGGNQMQVEVLNGQRVPWYLLNSHVRLRGICPNMKNSGGQKCAGLIIVANWTDVQVLESGPDQWTKFKTVTISDLSREASTNNGGIFSLHGHFRRTPMTQALQFEDLTGAVSINLLTGFLIKTNLEYDCLGQWSRDGTNLSLNQAVARESSAAENTNALHVLTTAMQVQQLTREEGDRKYPIEIEGVITSVSDDFRSFLIQDSSRAIFVWGGDLTLQVLPRRGDYCKIEGTSRAADFSPIVDLRKVTILWRGQMPQPLKPTLEQLLSGSLDSQYVEIRGMVIEAHDTYIILLTSEGAINLDITPSPLEPWKSLVNSIIRVRGCVRPNWDTATHRVIPYEPIHLLSATVSIDELPPIDLFAADEVRARDLTQFDVRFDIFRRVKIRGQIVHSGSNMDYLMDETTGLRFQLAQPFRFDPGDEIEVVGLVELGGPSPALRYAVARKTGHLPLPKPRPISLASLSNDYDSTMVGIEGTLVGLKNRGAEQMLEIQVGVKSFIARLNSKESSDLSLPIGGRLKLAGVFCSLDGGTQTGRDVNSFELLLNSPQDIQVIARPPWWTLSRLLVALACLGLGLGVTVVWIALLRHQVNRRTRQLEREIGERERAEKMRAIEHERSRIARDLHDDLGSTLTEISMMATATPGLKMESQVAADRLQEIADKSRSMISALDGVVWVVNSKNDTLSSLVEYLASYAEEFLAKARIACRVDLPKNFPERIIAAEIRHDVMLAVRESLNNAVRHGHPHEVLLSLVVNGNSLEIAVRDDGCGFEPAQVKGNGLTNLQQRMEKLNGSVQILPTPGGGVTVLLILPLS